MENNVLNHIYFIIIGMALVTYLSRELPFIVLKGKKLKPAIVEWLSFVPVAVLSALLMPALLTYGSSNVLNLSFSNYYLISGIAAFVFGIIVKNLFAVIIFGITFLAILRSLF